MELNDILYTPLDVPQRPDFDVAHLKSWLNLNYTKLTDYKNLLSKTGNAAEHSIENYPWNLTVAYYNLFDNNTNGWLGNFNLEFPELSKYMYESFNLSIEDVGLIVFLPIKENHTGLGFWHNDTDWYGMRHYMHFENSDKNKLLLRRTKIPYNIRPNFEIPIDENLFLQNEIVECKLLSSTQSFFLNNIRSVHATFTAIPNSTRIAAFVAGKIGRGNITRKKIENLIVNSAQKYSNYSIIWKSE